MTSTTKAPDMDIRFITFLDHGAYDVDPMDIPLCGVCDQPMFSNEALAIQTCDDGPGNPDLVRLTHRDCILDEDDDDDGDGEDVETLMT